MPCSEPGNGGAGSADSGLGEGGRGREPKQKHKQTAAAMRRAPLAPCTAHAPRVACITCRYMHSKECTFGLQHALHMLCILPPSSRMYPAIFWVYHLLLGANVGFEEPGSFGPNRPAEMPLMLGATWEPKCLEVLGPRLPAKEPLISQAMLGPACLEDWSQSAWKFWGPDCQQKSPQYRGQCWGQLAWKIGAKVPGSFWAHIASKRAPNIAGNLGASLPGRLEPKCLEVLGPRLPAKEPPILRAILGPVRLADGRQSAWKFLGPSCHQNSP